MPLLLSRRTTMIGALSLLGGCVASPSSTPVVERAWRDYFSDLDRPGIMIDTEARRLAYWAAEDAFYREYPVGVARTDELLRRGRTTVVRKRVGPDWRPTPSMIARNPSLPRYVPPGPDNPLGEYALYLGWQYFAIHGTNDPVTIGRRTTSGCFRLFPGHIEWLYQNTPIGTRVVVV